MAAERVRNPVVLLLAGPARRLSSIWADTDALAGSVKVPGFKGTERPISVSAFWFVCVRLSERVSQRLNQSRLRRVDIEVAVP